MVSDIQPLLDFIFERICAKDEALYKWHLFFMATILTQPEANYPVAQLFYSTSQGAGKGLYLNNLLGEGIFGEDNYVHLNDIGSLVAEKNHHVVNKLWVVVDEIDQLSSSQSKKLLSHIGDEMILHRKLYSDAKMTRNYNNIACAFPFVYRHALISLRC